MELRLTSRRRCGLTATLLELFLLVQRKAPQKKDPRENCGQKEFHPFRNFFFAALVGLTHKKFPWSSTTFCFLVLCGALFGNGEGWAAVRRGPKQVQLSWDGARRASPPASRARQARGGKKVDTWPLWCYFPRLGSDFGGGLRGRFGKIWLGRSCRCCGHLRGGSGGIQGGDFGIDLVTISGFVAKTD